MPTLFVPTERERDLVHANTQIQHELKQLNLHDQLQILGTRIVNARVMLRHATLHQQAGGSGKGDKDNALTGAYYEALEHYLTEFHGLDAALDYVDASSFERSGFFQDDSLLDAVIENSTARIACRRYQSPLDESSFNYPIAFSLPNYADAPLAQDTFNYASLRRYCCNSGIAIGATYNEAVLHAINECLERDALSLFLLNHFYYQHKEPLRVLERPGAELPLAQLWRDAEVELSAQVVVLDISNEFEAKTYLAFTLPRSQHAGIFGSGTSLSAEHAVTRALTELVQMQLGAQLPEVAHHLYHQERHLAVFPRLQRCLQLDLQALMLTANRHNVALPAAYAVTALDEQIQILAINMRQHQRELGISIMFSSERGTTLANVVIPGLERFYIVCSGNVVIPQARGLALKTRKARQFA